MKYFKDKECRNCFKRSKYLTDSNPFFCIVCGHKYDSFINSLPGLLIVLSFAPVYLNNPNNEYAFVSFILWLLAWFVHKFSKSLNLDFIDRRLIKKWVLIEDGKCSNGALILKESGGHFKITLGEIKISFDISRHSCFKNRLILRGYGEAIIYEYEINDSILVIKAYGKDLQFSSEVLNN